jgi:hypothetical protein
MIPTRATDAQLDEYITNITHAYKMASPDQIERGHNWYPVANQLALIVGNGDARVGAGVIAALSANKRWKTNQKLALDAAEGNIHGHTGVTLTKVQKILDGTDPEDVLPMALKTGNFYRAILDPEDPDVAVIDRHAHDVAVGRTFGEEDRGLGNKTRYATLALAYRLAARKLNEIPNALQAIVWIYQLEGNSKYAAYYQRVNDE